MANKIFLIFIFFLSLAAFPFLSIADEKQEDLGNEGLSGSVTFGGAGVGIDRRSEKFGEYSGIDDNEGFFVGGADLNYNRGPYYTDFFAEDLGLDNRNLYLETGKYGDYKFFAAYDQLPQLLSVNSKTPLDGVGGTFLELPAGFVRANTTSGTTITGVKDVDLEIDDRVAQTFGLAKTFGKYEFNLKFHREDKDGLKSLGGTFGSNGGDARAIVFPEAFKQTVNEVQATLSHNGKRVQAQFEYFLSLYDNRIESISLRSPFTPSAVLADSGLISRAPDNQYHKMSLSGGINLTPSTRVAGIAEYGLMLQDETLFPFGVGTSASLLPRQTANTELHTLHFGLNVSSRPTPKLTLSGKYKHYQTINKTPKELFLYINNDAGGQVAVTSGDALFNEPYDYSQDQLKLDAAYRIFKATNLKAGYEVELFNRDFREVEKTIENTFKAGVRSSYFSFAPINLNVSYSKKIGDEYDAFRVFSSRHTSSFVTPTGFDSLPDLRRSDIANRDRLKFKGNVTFLPSDSTTLGVSYNFVKDDYPNSSLGLKYHRGQDVTVDVNFSPAEAVSYYAYYTFQRGQYQQNSRSHNPFIAGSATDPTRDWRSDLDDISNTVGVGTTFGLLDNKLTVNTDYSYSQSISDITFSSGSALTTENLPDLKTSLHTIKTKWNYQLTKHVDLAFSYLFEIFEDNDFATDSIGPATSELSNVLLLSGTLADYNAHVGMVSATYHFGGRT